MSTIINGTAYYDLAFVKEKNPDLTKGCVTVNRMLEKRKIPDDAYVFVSYSKNKGYTILSHDSTYKAKRLMLKVDWVDKNIAPFCKVVTSMEKECPKYDLLPDRVYLEDTEIFNDEQGNAYPLTIRGERKTDRIFFKSKDVGEMINIQRIRNTITSNTSSFHEGVDYVYFQNLDHHGEKDSASSNTKVTYLTYHGLIHLLFVRRHPVAQKFCRWATEILFAAQYGTVEQRREVSSNIMGITVKTLKSFMNTSTNTMPVIYLFYLGNMGEVRKKLGISEEKYPHIKDSYHVFKYGLSENFKQRAEKHEATFKKYGIEPLLKYHTYIDPFHLQNAENDLRDWFKGYNWHLQEHKTDLTELGVVQSDLCDRMLHEKFSNLSKVYNGKLQDFISRIDHLEYEKKKSDEYIEELRKHCEQNRQDYHQNMERMRELYERFISALEKR